MSTAPYLQLISEVLPIQRRDFYMSDPTLLNPQNANPVLDGEWLSLDSSYKLIRAAGATLGGVAGVVSMPSWQLFAERGRYDTQAIGKAPLLFIGGHEAETSICDVTSLNIGDGLVVADVTVGGLTKKGLKKYGTTATYPIRGWVTRLPGSGKVRYWVPGDIAFMPVA